MSVDARTIKVPIEDLREVLDYNPDTGTFFWRERPRRHFKTHRAHSRWNTMYKGKQALYTDRGEGYLAGRVFGRTFRAHRVAFAIYHGFWPEGEVDHINRNRSDNRIDNLRSIDKLGNMRNQSKSKNNTSGKTGVYWHNRIGKWQVSVCVNGKNKHIGYFIDLEEAAVARKKAQDDLGYSETHGL